MDLLLSLLVGVALSAQRPPARCVSELGEPFDPQACPLVELPGFEIERVGEGRPNPDLPVWCVEYEVRSASEAVELSLCSTGELGGTAGFALDGVDYVVDRDVPVRCVEGRWQLGLTIWRDGPKLQPFAERSPQLESFLCEGEAPRSAETTRGTALTEHAKEASGGRARASASSVSRKTRSP